MSEGASRRYTYAEYVELERHTGLKHEYFRGRVLRMDDVTPEHVEIASNLLFSARRSLQGHLCKVYSASLKICVGEDDLSTYADLAIVGVPLQRSAIDENAVRNPSVLVEVLSEATALYDRVEKFEHYQKIATLRDYVLVDQHRPSVDHLRRNPDQSWTLRTLRLTDTLHLESLGVSIPIADIYAGVALQPGTRRLG